MAKLVGISIELAQKIRIYIGRCPHDDVKDLLAEFDSTAQTIKVEEEKAEVSKD